MVSAIRRHILKVLYGFLLTAFTIYVLLDAFVIPRAYLPAENGEYNTASDMEDPLSGSSSVDPVSDTDFLSYPAVTENSYMDENIHIVLSAYRRYDTDIYVADIRLSGSEYLKTALAQSTYGRNIKAKTSQIAADCDAILAINGDFYGSQTKGYVLRNGVLYREIAAGTDQEDLVIWADGSFEIITEGTVSAADLASEGAQQILSFGPALVKDGIVAVSSGEEVDKAMASNPRTAIALLDSLHYLMVVADGRTSQSQGLSLYQLALFLQEMGVKTAYNLDGGGSSTMVFNGEVINHPTTNGAIKERSVSDIVYIGI